jgi:phosphoribosylglycinamide formyltransferase-1
MNKIAIFAYDFPHRKTHDFIIDLLSLGVNNLCVFGAPWVELPVKEKSPIPQLLQIAPPVDTAELCKNFKINYISTEHDDYELIAKYVREQYIDIAIVVGARILTRSIISLFRSGVVNFHPGKIPETSGLDSIFYTIKYGIPLGVTTHFIDERVDAGRFLRFDELALSPENSLSDVLENNYQLQRKALRYFLSDLLGDKLNPINIDRPKKNVPMSAEEKISVVNNFDNWKKEIILNQIFKNLIEGCEIDNINDVKKILHKNPIIINRCNENGWTPLIVACHNGCLSTVKLLLDYGADPNICGSKGTTPLMYAKTPLLHKKNVKYDILKILLDNGADPNKKDYKGWTVIDYVRDKKDIQMLDFICNYNKQ